MTDNEQSQLRFDISEKINFHDELPGIDTLLSLDLTPEVRIEDLGANVQIAGVIRLSGTYLAQSDVSPAEQAEQLADISEVDEEVVGESIHYVIPVEITLPAERVSRLQDITAEIQSFDYELQSTHELAIDALLVVDGLQLGSEVSTSQASFGEQESEAEKPLITSQEDSEDEVEAGVALSGEEPFREYGFQPIDESRQQDRLTDQSEDATQPEKTTFVEQQPLDFPNELDPPNENAEATKESFDRQDEQSEMDNEVVVTPTQSTESATEKELAPAEADSIQSENNDSQTKTMQEERPQTKIRFQPKVERKSSDAISLNEMLVKEDMEAVEDEGDSLGKTHNHDASYQQTDDGDDSGASDESLSADDSLDAQASETASLSGIQLMKQHLAGTDEHFQRLRMVIVQKEDTLESIADRYELSSVELLQLNKLESGELEQGQIVYLPNRTDEP